jgi:hypothetical protein
LFANVKIHRNNSDVKKLIPFAFLAILAPELIVILLLRGSNLIPSTCISNEHARQRSTTLAKKRLSTSEKLSAIHGNLGWEKLKNCSLEELNIHSMPRKDLTLISE